MKNQKLLASISLLLVMLFLSQACQKPTPANLASQNKEGNRVVVKTDQGPYIGVDTAALARLQTYRKEKNPASASYHFGRAATAAEISAWNIRIGSDGKGLPTGSGSVAEGANLYKLSCAACHGLKGEGVAPYNSPLVAKESSGKTIGSYWPYATTLFDYIRRAMPYTTPGSLSDSEVYSLTAYLLFLNEIIEEDVSLDAENLPKIVMPNIETFVPDNRETSNAIH